MTDDDELLAAAWRAMDTAADMARAHEPVVSRAKGDRDMVTNLDIEIERAVRASLARDAPHVAFLGEEESQTGEGRADLGARPDRRHREPRPRPALIRGVAGPGPSTARRSWASLTCPCSDGATARSKVKAPG